MIGQFNLCKGTLLVGRGFKIGGFLSNANRHCRLLPGWCGLRGRRLRPLPAQHSAGRSCTSFRLFSHETSFICVSRPHYKCVMGKGWEDLPIFSSVSCRKKRLTAKAWTNLAISAGQRSNSRISGDHLAQFLRRPVDRDADEGLPLLGGGQQGFTVVHAVFVRVLLALQVQLDL